MMNMLEEAIVYATIMHQGKVRKFGGRPFILHPMEVAQILSTMTDDMEVIAAGILHDVVEDTDGTLSEIEKRLGERVAHLVHSESEDEYPGEDRSATWQRRKEGSILNLRKSRDVGVKMLWLADKLANLRSLSQTYSEQGEAMWAELHQGDSEAHLWYYNKAARTGPDIGWAQRATLSPAPQEAAPASAPPSVPRGRRLMLTGSRVRELASSSTSSAEALGAALSLPTDCQKFLQPLRKAASRRPQSL